MECPGPESLDAYVDDDLPGEALGQIALHLNGCADCAAMVAELRASRSLWQQAARASWERLPQLLGGPARTPHLSDELIAGYLADALGASLTEQVRAHMLACATCFREVRLTRHLGQALEADEPEAVRAAVREVLATPAPTGARPTQAVAEPVPPLGARLRDALRLVWELNIPVLRPASLPVPAMAADQLVETRATADGAVQVSVEVRLPDEGLAVDEDVPITIHILAAPDRPELVDIAFACELQEGSEVVWEGVIQLVRRRGHLQASVPRPQEQGYQIRIEPVDAE